MGGFGIGMRLHTSASSEAATLFPMTAAAVTVVAKMTSTNFRGRPATLEV